MAEQESFEKLQRPGYGILLCLELLFCLLQKDSPYCPVTFSSKHFSTQEVIQIVHYPDQVHHKINCNWFERYQLIQAKIINALNKNSTSQPSLSQRTRRSLIYEALLHVYAGLDPVHPFTIER
ncbi:MAG: hypothetical protein WKF70_15060, partial [Chitinophagaceae bacterium]